MSVGSSRTIALVSLITIISLFSVVSLRWVFLYRNNVLLDIDEAGYLRMAMQDYRVLTQLGVASWIKVVLGPGIHSPIVPATASLVFTVFHPSAQIGILVPILAGSATIAMSYLLTLRLSSSRLVALACAGLVATCPYIIIYSRSFHFSLPATALLIAAIWAVAASDHFRRRGINILLGVLVGLLPLTRTMTVAFLPGLLLGCAIHAFTSETRSRSLAGLTLACCVAIAVAASWFASSAGIVMKYLLSFGYGTRAVDYGPKSSVLSIDSWALTFEHVRLMLFAPHTLVVLLGTICAVILIISRAAKTGICLTMMKVLSSQYLSSISTVVFGLAALTSTSNKGSAFMLPLLPVMLILSGISIFQMFDRLRPIALASLTAVSVFAFVPMVDMKSSLAAVRTIRMPVLGDMILTQGTGAFDSYYAAVLGRNSHVGQPIPSSERNQWIMLFHDLSVYLRQTPGSSIAFGFRHMLVSANHIPLQLDFAGEKPRVIMQLDPFQLGQSEQAYIDYLRKGKACILLLAEGEKGDFPPPMDGRKVRRAAQEIGFSIARTWPMIGDRTLELMRRPDC